jgi:hypothetical protein
MVKTQSAFQPHDSTIFPVYNPLPGPWFAIAYLSPFEEKITQQGDLFLAFCQSCGSGFI